MLQSQGYLQFCPNPDRSSKVCKMFLSKANLNKHFGAKPACYKYARSILNKYARSILNNVLKESALAEQKILSLGADGTTNYAAAYKKFREPVIDRTQEEELEAIVFPMPDGRDYLDDSEDGSFYNPEFEDNDFHGYTTVYTKEQKFEIILLKLCTEMEALLYAFEEIMKRARNAHKHGYEFLPNQTTYYSQINILENWMGMEKHIDQRK
jgi:hypothetical protein